jgi:hypothetical protein
MPAKKQSRRTLPDIYKLHIELVGVNPAIWRQVLVPDGCSLAVLHSVVQESFGWQDYHLFRFEYQDREFERPDAESSAENAEKVTLKSLALTTGSSLRYIYDFGDDWEHAIRFVGVRPLQLDRLYPYCVDGARAGPRRIAVDRQAMSGCSRFSRIPRIPSFSKCVRGPVHIFIRRRSIFARRTAF